MDGNTKTLIIHPVSVVLGFPVGDKFVLLSKAGMFSVTSFDEIVGTIGQAITDNAPGRGYNRVTNVELATCSFNIETGELDFVKLRTVQDFVNLANGDTVVAWLARSSARLSRATRRRLSANDSASTLGGTPSPVAGTGSETATFDATTTAASALTAA